MSERDALAAALTDRYSIDKEIGRGGMATVYLARDVKHHRPVALKLLSPELGAILGVERFLAEIRVTANLQHPNLLPLFDSGEVDGLLFYVMPYVEGESLRNRIDREKQLPVADALRITTAIASALDYAHRHGVIHRDLKPENILLHEGQPLVADFGIALAVSNAGGTRITQTGLSLGTPHYMSPEQATGDRAIDGRTDIYSLGALSYEMLTGEPPHSGTTAQAIIAKVLTDKPRSMRLSRPSVPPYVEAAIDRALEKLPADRWATAHEFAEALTTERTVPVRGGFVAQSGQRSRARTALTGLGLAAALAIAAGIGAWLRHRAEEPRTPVRFMMNLEPNQRVVGATPPIALSPDGQMVVLRISVGGAAPRLFIRSMNELHARELPGTEGAAWPFFSPDGKWVAFMRDLQLKKVSVDGGTPVVLADVPAMGGGSWGPRDQIVVSTAGHLAVLPGTGGPPKAITTLDSASGEIMQREPLLLTDGETVLYLSWRGSLQTLKTGLASIRGGKTRIIDGVPGAPVGVVDNYLIFTSGEGTNSAVQFDAAAGRVVGRSVPVLDGILVSLGGVQSKISASGTAAYVGANGTKQLVLVDPHGAASVLLPELRSYSSPRLSPDGRKLAVTIDNASSFDIYVLDIVSGTLSRLSTGATISRRPEWAPDGTHVLYSSDRDHTQFRLWSQPVDMSGPPTPLFGANGVYVGEGVMTPDAAAIVVRGTDKNGNGEIWYHPLSGDTSTKALVTGRFSAFGPRVSPDGKWLAYASNESSRSEVYVTPMPGAGARIQVSANGGMTPVWSRDGRGLYYVAGQQLMEATLAYAPTLSVTARKTIIDGGLDVQSDHADYDVAADGKVVLIKNAGVETQVIVVHDWKYELRARMQANGR